jgi:hypothetical protein
MGVKKTQNIMLILSPLEKLQNSSQKKASDTKIKYENFIIPSLFY